MYVDPLVHETMGLCFTGSLCILGTKYIACVSILCGTASLSTSPLVTVLSCRHDARYCLKCLVISCVGALFSHWYSSLQLLFKCLCARSSYCDVAMITVISPLSALEITI